MQELARNMRSAGSAAIVTTGCVVRPGVVGGLVVGDGRATRAMNGARKLEKRNEVGERK